jgi:hypothetical protein
MSSTDKTKLDGIESGAEVNQNAFSIFAVSGQSDVIADTESDTLTLVAGTGITVTTDNTTDTITITATGTAAPQPHASTHVYPSGSDIIYGLTGEQIKSSATIDADRAISTDHIKNLAVTDAKINTMTATKLTGTIDNARLNTATTASAGIVQLNDTLTSTSVTEALTANQGKELQDSKLNLTGGTLTGLVTISPAGSGGALDTPSLDFIDTGTGSGNASLIRFYNDSGKTRFLSQIKMQNEGTNGVSGGHVIFSTNTTNTGNPSEVMRVANTGRVGIGVTVPTEKLDVSGNIKSSGTITSTGMNVGLNNKYTFYDGSPTNGAYLKTNSNGDIQVFNGTGGIAERITILANGNVGINNISPAERLDVTGNIKSSGTITSGGLLTASNGFTLTTGTLTLPNNSITDAMINTIDGGTITTGTVSSARLPVASSSADGIVNQISQTFAGAKTFNSGLTLNGTNEARGATSSVVHRFFNTTFGSQAGAITITGQNSVTYGQGSDYRLKTNFEPLLNALDKLKSIPVYKFNWNQELDKPKVDGFIAHEVQAVVPEAIVGEKDDVDEEGNPIYQQIDQSKLVPLLFKAVQELSSKLEELELKIQSLESGGK